MLFLLTLSFELSLSLSGIQDAEMRLNAAMMQFELTATMQDQIKVRQAEAALSDAKQGLRVLSKGHKRLQAAEHVLCIHSKDFLNLRPTDPVPRPESEVSKANAKLAELNKIKDEQEKEMSKLNSYAGDSSTFDILQNLRLEQGEDECM